MGHFLAGVLDFLPSGVDSNDGTRPVIFKIERIDIPETEEEREWLEKQNFKNTAEDAYTG